MREMIKKMCGKCGRKLICKEADIKTCACSRLKLSLKTLDFLTKTYFDCLCTDCLEEIDQRIVLNSGLSFPAKKEEFMEGVHYYLEGNRWVFTELYHLLKGSCCGNGCRHCVYGFEKPGQGIS